MRDSYTVFVHLTDAEGDIVSQKDKVPGERSKQPTTTWVDGEVIVDPVAIPIAPEVAPGIYRLLVGLYLAPEGPRLPLTSPIPGPGSNDALHLTDIEIIEPASRDQGLGPSAMER